MTLLVHNHSFIQENPCELDTMSEMITKAEFNNNPYFSVIEIASRFFLFTNTLHWPTAYYFMVYLSSHTV